MEPWHIAGSLVSAVLHAGWNAAVKVQPRPRDTMTAQMILAAAIGVPGLLWSGLPPAAAMPWLLASTSLNLVAVTGLLRAYALTGFGLAYPVVRALSVLMVVPLAALLSGERLSGFGLAGVALIAGALLLLALGNRGRDAVPARAIAWIALTGIATAAYVMCDAQGVRRAGAPWGYGFTVSITNAVLMSCVQRFGGDRTGGGPWRVIAAEWKVALPAAVASATSYLLILWVWTSAPIAPAAALRDTSAVFALVIAILWLKEPFTGLRLAAILLAALAVPLLRLA